MRILSSKRLSRAAGSGLPTGSLRRRVSLSALGLLVVVLLGLGLLVNTLLRSTLRSDLRTRLEDRASYAALLQEQGVTGQVLADKLAGGGVLSAFTTAGGSFIGRPAEPPNQPGAPPAPRPRPTVTPTVTFTEGDGRVTATVTFAAGTLRLQADDGDVERTLAELQRIEALAGLGALLVGGSLLLVVMNRALRPLTRMGELARRIAGGARGARLHPRSPTTDLGRTAAAFDGMLDALEHAERTAQAAEARMRAFLADASHDLRTPLAGVIAGAEQMLRDPGSRADREARLVAVVRQARRGGKLVDDLLLMAQLDGHADHAGHGSERVGATGISDSTPGGTEGPGPGVTVDLGAVVAAETAAARLRHPEVAFVATGPATPVRVRVDPDRLPRVVANLLDNAARSGAGRVELRTSADGGARLSVRDDGRGVPAADRERVFDRFVRLDPARSGPGSGLGLPISRAIARAEGGDVCCLPTGTGACFELRLPTARTVPEAAGSHRAAPVTASGGWPVAAVR